MENKKKIALVLSGGAAKGSMQFGILKYLCEQGLKPNVVYGTSVGSLNACGYSHVGIEGLEQFWARIKKMSDVFKFNWTTLLFLSKGLYHGKPLRALIAEVVASGKPSIPTYACKVNLVTGETVYTEANDPDYIDSVLASSSVPGISEPVGEWVDGGVREQSPLKKAIDDGADKIIVILCNPYRENPEPGDMGNWIKNAIRATDILSHEVFKNDIDSCLWYNRNLMPGKRFIEIEVYAPEKLVIDSHDFTQEKIQPAIQYGYECAKKGPVIKETK